MRNIPVSCVCLLLCLAMPCFAQVTFMGKVWAPEPAGTPPESTGFPEEYFSGDHPGNPPGVYPLAGLRCFGSPLGSDAETAAGASWATHPTGWYDFIGAPGNYTVLFTGPVHLARPTVLTNIILRQGEAIDRKVLVDFDTSNFDFGGWDDEPAHACYQTFRAKSTSVTNVGFHVVHDGVDGYEPGGQPILVSVHRVGDGPPETWEQIGPTGVVPHVDGGGAKNYDWIVAWNSGEVPLVPGERYAVRLEAEQPDGVFQMFWREARDEDHRVHTVRADGNTEEHARELWLTVTGDGDGLLIPYNKHVQKDHGTFAGFAEKWTQTWIAQGRGLAGVVLYAAAHGSQPSMNRQRVVFRVRRGGPDGPLVGVEKIGIGNGIHTGDASWGTYGAAFGPGEVNLEPGETYALEMETLETPRSLDGYVNIKDVPSNNIPGFNPYQPHEREPDQVGDAYRNGTEKMPFDLDMQIIEYEHAEEGWPDAVTDRRTFDVDTTGNWTLGSTTLSATSAGAPYQTFNLSGAMGTAIFSARRPDSTPASPTLFAEEMPADGGFVVPFDGLNHGENYRLRLSVNCSYRVHPDRRVMVGYDLTGQTSDPEAATIHWTMLPPVRSVEVPWDSGPIRPEQQAISLWLRAQVKSEDRSIPFHARFSDIGLYRIHTGLPRGEDAAYTILEHPNSVGVQ